jgi:hypothetical protein
MHTMQPSALRPVANPTSPQPNLDELAVRHHTMLSPRKLRKPSIQRGRRQLIRHSRTK